MIRRNRVLLSAALALLLAGPCMGCKAEDDIVVVRTPEPDESKLVEIHTEVAQQEHRVTADGSGELSVLPDTVQISGILRFRATNSENASSLATIGRAYVSRAMRALGVASADITFEDTAIREMTQEDRAFFEAESAEAEPELEDPQDTDDGEAEPAATPEPEEEAEKVVYTHIAECAFSITLQDVDLLTRAQKEMDSIENLYVAEFQTVYLLADYEGAYRAALALALENARLKAETVAMAGGVKLGKLAEATVSPMDTEAVRTAQAANEPITVTAQLIASYLLE